MFEFVAAFARLFFRPKSGLRLSENEKRIEGPGVIYHGDDSLPYGRTATKQATPIKALVIHHPASAKGCSIDDLIRFINQPRRDGNMYGYHFVIDTDGTIYQTAPLTKRTNHVKPSAGPKRRKFGSSVTNANALGICFHLASHNPDSAPNQAQIEAGKTLVRALQEIYDPFNVFGHGEIQTDRHKDEGRVFAEIVRKL